MNKPIRRNAPSNPNGRAAVATVALDEMGPPPSLLVRALMVCFFVFDFPAFTLQLATDASTGRFTGSPVFAVMTVAGNVFVAILFSSSQEVRQLAKRTWPVLAMLGLGLISTAWSINPKATIAVTIRNAGAFYLAIAIVALMPGFRGVRFVIRTLVLGCALSMAWVFIFPDAAVHHETDIIQAVHAGLWRGIFSHKQGLGVFAGLTTGLLLVYRTLIFQPVVLVGAIACCLTCLVGSGSATGFITMILVLLVFYLSLFVARSPQEARKGRLLAVAVIFVASGIAFKGGLLDPVIHLLGKSSDLTGRADLWPLEIAAFNSSGRSWLGGGLGGGLALDISEWSIDNGYLDMIIEFGYLVAPILFMLYGLILWKGALFLINSPRESASTSIFPFAIWIIILIDNITESGFMSKTYITIISILAIALLYEERKVGALNLQKPSRRTAGVGIQSSAHPTRLFGSRWMR